MDLWMAMKTEVHLAPKLVIKKAWWLAMSLAKWLAKLLVTHLEQQKVLYLVK